MTGKELAIALMAAEIYKTCGSEHTLGYIDSQLNINANESIQKEAAMAFQIAKEAASQVFGE